MSFSNWLSIIDSKRISFPSSKNLSYETFTTSLYNELSTYAPYRAFRLDNSTQPAKLTPLYNKNQF